MSTSFDSLGLPAPLVRALADRNITEPFPIQTAAIPHGLDGEDISGKAPTGSGKTLAFGAPLLSRVAKARHNQPHALILAPTRELAEQIKVELAPLARAMDRRILAVYGGVGYGPQKGALGKGVDVVVATPGRLEDLIQQRSIDLRCVEIVVVDEADRMADMGFLPAVRRILDQTSSRRQTMLFSATLDRDVAVLSRDYQSGPITIEADAVEQDTVAAVHHFWRTKSDTRIEDTADLVTAVGRSIVFTRTRHGADRLARQLSRAGVSAVSMHGGRSQGQRTRALGSFSSGRASALVATDVAARGIHVDDIACVIHYDLAGDAKDYLHRSGRTGRAGAAGLVVTLVMPDKEREARRLQQAVGLQLPIESPSPKTLGSSTSPTSPPQRSHGAKSHPAGRDHGRSSIYVGNLPWKTSEGELRGLFAGHGAITAASIAVNRRTGRSKGYGFVEMAEDDTHRAISALQGATLGGRNLNIRMAHV